MLLVEKTDAIPLPDQKTEKIKEIEEKKQNPETIENEVKQVSEFEKDEAIDKKLLRYLTVRVKKFDLETNYFGKKEDSEKKESLTISLIYLCLLA